MADLVLWDPAFFGAKPEIIIKGGYITWAQMGQFGFQQLSLSLYNHNMNAVIISNCLKYIILSF